jgi:hypothetical protein
VVFSSFFLWITLYPYDNPLQIKNARRKKKRLLQKKKKSEEVKLVILLITAILPSVGSFLFNARFLLSAL